LVRFFGDPIDKLKEQLQKVNETPWEEQFGKDGNYSLKFLKKIHRATEQIEKLEKSGDSRLVEVLCQILPTTYLSHTNYTDELILHIIQTLGRLNDRKTIPALKLWRRRFTSTTDFSHQAKREVDEILIRFGEPSLQKELETERRLEQQQREKEEHLRWEAQRAPVDRLRQGFEELLSKETPESDLRVTAVKLLAQVGKREVEDLQKIRTASGPSFKAVKLLLKSIQGEKSCFDLAQACLDFVKSREIHVKMYTELTEDLNSDLIRALGTLASADHEATLGLLANVASSKSAKLGVRSAAINGLGHSGDPAAVKPLINILKEEDDVRGLISDAACALVDLKDPRGVVPVVESIKHFPTGNWEEWRKRDYITKHMSEFLKLDTEEYRIVVERWRTLKSAPLPPDFSPYAVNVNKVIANTLEPIVFTCGGAEAITIAKDWAHKIYTDGERALKGTETLIRIESEETTVALCEILSRPRLTFIVQDQDDRDRAEEATEIDKKQRILVARALARRGGRKAIEALQLATAYQDPEVAKTAEEALSTLKNQG